MAGFTLASFNPRRSALFPPRRGGGATTAVAVGAVPIPALVPSRTRLPGRGRGTLAAAIPGNSVVESVTVGGFANFFGIYGNLLIARVLLSWFPAAQNVRFLSPLYTVCDPFLNFFRGVIPPVFGLDLSPIIGFTLLNALTSATVALGAEAPGAAGAPASAGAAAGQHRLRLPWQRRV
ncbi:hypothetical protein MMPV_003773 [Pyropia vietnamensis]